MKTMENLPTHQSMKQAHRVRRFRRGNSEKGRAYLGLKPKPWRTNTNNSTRSAA